MHLRLRVTSLQRVANRNLPRVCPLPTRAVNPEFGLATRKGCAWVQSPQNLRQSLSKTLTFASTNEMAGADKEQYAEEQQLLLAAKSLDQALVEKDTSLLDKAFDENVLLHRDNITVKEDISGASGVKQYYADYWTNYDYKHSPVVTAANGKTKTAFTFAVDEDVKRKSGRSGKDLSVSIWAYEFNDNHKITEIWFLRSLVDEEVEQQMKKAPQDLGLTAADYFKWREPQLAPDAGRTDALYKAAEAYSKMWGSGEPAEAGTFVESGFHEMDPLLGNEIKSREELEKAIKSLGLMWTCTNHSHLIAVTPDSLKAFVLWKQQGKFKETDKADSLYGLNLMRFDEHHKIERVLGFRQVMRGEREKVLK